MTGKVPNLATDELPLEDETIATDQGAVPLPYFAGTRKLAVRWLGPAAQMITKESPTQGGKKSGKAQSKGGSGSKSYDYYGTVFAGLAYGPLDKFHSVIVSGKAVWENPSGLARSGDTSDLTGSIDSKYFTDSGYLKLLWGTATQAADAAETANGHPANPHIARLAAKNVLFGTETTTAPNIEAIAARLPVCDTDLCAADKNIFDDGQINPVAMLAEMLTCPIGPGWPVDRFHAASWAAAGAYCHTNRAICFCSPLFTDYADLRTPVATLLQMFDGALAWTADGLLALKLMKYGTDPGGLVTLDANHFMQRPTLNLGGWGDVPTGIVLRYVDRDRKFKEADEKLDNLIALHVRGEDDRRALQFPHVTRRNQILALAAQAIRRQMHPQASADLIVREPFANLFPGDKLKVDVDPEPGGDGLAQLGIVTERHDDGSGTVGLKVNFDPIAESAPYTPGTTPPEPQDATVGAIPYALALPLPGAKLGIVAARPQADAVGFRVLFQQASGTGEDQTDLGTQPGFAVRCSLDANITGADDTIRLTLLDGADGLDAYLASRTAGTGIEAANDLLLLVLADVDGNGRVTADADGLPNLEFCSIVSRSAVDSDTHDYTVLRARKSLKERAWNTGGGTTAWIIPGRSLVEWSHEYFAGMISSGAIGYLQLAAFTNYAEQETDLLEISFIFPAAYLQPPSIAWTTPAADSYTLASTGLLAPDADIADADGNLVRVELFSRNAAGVHTWYFDLPLAPTGAITLAACLTAAGISTTIDLGTQTGADQYFTLILRVTDAAGSIVESSRTLILPGSSGAGLGGVTYDPSATDFVGSLALELTVGGSATKIHYAKLALGSSAPGAYTTVNATTANLTLYSSGRVWSRASDGVNHSAWQYQDFNKVAYLP